MRTYSWVRLISALTLLLVVPAITAGCVSGVRNPARLYQVQRFARSDSPFTAFPVGSMTVYNQTICADCPKGLVVDVYLGTHLLCDQVEPGSGFMFISPERAFTLRFVSRDDGKVIAHSVEMAQANYGHQPYRPSMPVRYRDLAARYVHPDKRVMQVANRTVCPNWPEGVRLRFSCNGQLLAELKPHEDTAITLPAQAFTLRVTVLQADKEIAHLATDYPDASTWAQLPSTPFTWASFQDKPSGT